MRHLIAAALSLIASEALALTAREVIEQAQAWNGFSTWHDRKSLVTLEGFDGEVSRVTREAEVYEQTDPRGEHRTLMEFLSPDDFKGTRYLHVSPRRARQVKCPRFRGHQIPFEGRGVHDAQVPRPVPTGVQAAAH